MKNNSAHLREVLQRMSTEELDELLNEQIRTKAGDGEIVRQILRILQAREKDFPVEMTIEKEKAWETYQKEIAQADREAARPFRMPSGILKVASALIVLVMLFAVLPQQAQAESLWEKLVRWTAGIVEFFSPDDNEHRLVPYQFETDNPGLQQVYDAVVELGVTDPVVPMWLPEESELIELKVVNSPRKQGVLACFSINDSELVYKMDFLGDEYAHKYHGDINGAVKYEKSEIIHNIIRNDERWVIIWNRENIECSIALDCQEEIMYNILESIYVMEDK